MKQLKILPEVNSPIGFDSFLFKQNITEDEERDCLKLFEYLKYGFGESTYNKFLKSAKYAGLRKERNAIVLIVKNDFIKSIILQNYFKDISAFVYSNCTIAKKIEIVVKDTGKNGGISSTPVVNVQSLNSIASTSRATPVINKVEKKQIFQAQSTGSRVTFDNFIFGESNKLAYWSAVQASEMMISNDNHEIAPRLCIFGPVGMGKTHLMQSIVAHVKEAKPNLNIQYISAEEFKDFYVESVRSNSLFKFQKRFEDIDILLLDDVQFISSTTGNIEKALDKILNHFMNQRKWIVLACDRPPSELKVDVRTKSRISAGFKASIQQSDFTLRMLILQSKLRRMYDSYEIPLHLLEYIAQNVMSSIRELEAILHNIMNYAKVMKVSTIKDSMVHEIVGRCDFVYKPMQLAKTESYTKDESGIDPDKIISVVCRQYNIRLDEILGKGRTQKVSRARCIAAYILREKTNMTLKEIGDKLNRNHATVVYLINSVVNDKSLLDDAEKCQKNMM